MCLISRLFLEQVLFLTSLALILGSSTLLNNYNQRRTSRLAESRQFTQSILPKYRYYSNKKGTQVIEIGPENACQIFQGEDAALLRESKGEVMKALGYIQFRLMVGKCQLDAFLNNRATPYAESQQIETKAVIENNNNTFTNSNTNGESSNNDTNSESGQDPSKNETNNSNDNDVTTTEPPRLPLIFPGTKWCGAGSTASGHDDLGIYIETDICCREHDLCEDNMEGKECKHGLCNDSEYTRSHCDCDDKFRSCLQRDKSISSLASFKIANLYFNILKPLCFDKRPPVKWCRRHRITGECIEFEFDSGYRSEWQFFPAQPYLSQTVEKLIRPAIPSLPIMPTPPFFPPPPPMIPEFGPPINPIPDNEEDEEDERKRILKFTKTNSQ